MTQKFRTLGFKGYAVEYSPFFEDRLACASAANYGIVGNGKLWILNTNLQGINLERMYDTQDGLFDCAWSEVHENQIVTGSGDGSIKLWDITLADFPIRNWHEHQREVFSVNWNLVKKDTFISGSWDFSIKLWNPEFPRSLQTWKEHTGCVYAASWCPTLPDTFASASSDQLIKVWDTRSPKSSLSVHAHTNEILSLDWNKYLEHTVCTGSVDNSVKMFDLRNSSQPVRTFVGHEFAVRRVKCSPHDGNVVGSVSYDMTFKAWNLNSAAEGCVFTFGEYSEFVMGLDFSLYKPGEVATCSWDESVQILRI
ncbi:peroxisomal targeting signal 2 receptor [Nowakowskiella sp. JEL0407]|nr:peroxisomal targeting signal 2 receptor [Nowakowskiella sp. JEL0407]